MALLTAVEPRRRVRLPAQHRGQRRVFLRRRRRNVGVFGRRWWKTSGLVGQSALRAVEGQQLLWGAPTYDQCRVAWDELRRMCDGVARFHETRFTAFFPNGGQIVFRSLDNPDNARGFTLDGVVIDEASDVAPEAWYDVIAPMLMTTRGWSWLIGTPKGRNWFWAEYQRVQQSPIGAAWNAPTLGCRITDDGRLIRVPHPLENPHVPFSEIQMLFETMTERSFRQEILAEFLEAAGGVVRGVRAAATATMQTAPVPGHHYVCGVDWGKYNDYTVFYVIDATARAAAYVDRMVLTNTDLQVQRLRLVYERFRPGVIVVEENGIGIALADQLEAAGLPLQRFTTTAASKKAIIETLALAIEKGDLRLLDGKTTVGQIVIDEHEAYEATRLPGGGLRFGAPPGGHDDTVMANALAWHAVVGERANPWRGAGLGLGRVRGW